MKVDVFYGTVSDETLLAKADAVITPFKKGVKSFLPGFVQSAVAPENRGGDRASLNPEQQRRAVRYYQAWSRVAGLIAFTTVKDIYITNGKMVGTFLLKRMYNHGCNVKFHNFPPEAWPEIVDQDMNSDVTVHIFFSKAVSEEYTPDSSAVQVECFRPEARFTLPSYLEAILADLRSETPVMSNEYKKRICSLFYFVTLLHVAKQVGCKFVAVLEAEAFKEEGMKIFKSEFPNASLKGFPAVMPISGTDALQVPEKKELAKAAKPTVIIGENDFVNKPSGKHSSKSHGKPAAEQPARPAKPTELAALASKFSHGDANVTA